MANQLLSCDLYLILSGHKRRGWPTGPRNLKAERIVLRTSSLPSLHADEVAVRLQVSVPAALFERPELTVRIDVCGETPRVNIDADVMESLNSRLAEILGTPVTITVDLPDEVKV